MSELAGWMPDWLPARSLRSMAADDAAARREERQRVAAREARRSQAEDRAAGSFRQLAEMRGEDVDALALARGEAGRTLADVLDGARGDLERDYAPQQPVDERFYGEPVIGRSSGWPGSDFEVDRMLGRCSDLHADLVAYRARHDYQAALSAARSKGAADGAASDVAVRSRSGGELNTYQVPAGGWEAVRSADAAEGVARRTVEGAFVSVR
jgi:hypothetical protein